MTHTISNFYRAQAFTGPNPFDVLRKPDQDRQLKKANNLFSVL